MNFPKLKLDLLKKGKKLTIIFIPIHNECAVSSVRGLLEGKVKKHDLIEFKNSSNPHVVRNDHVVIYGHPDGTKLGFAQPKTRMPVLPNNFHFSNPRLKVFGNVCYGHQVLTGNQWSKIIDNSISYNSIISHCVGTHNIDKFWQDFYLKQLKNFSKNNSTASHEYWKGYLIEQIKLFDKMSIPGSGDGVGYWP